MLTWATRERLAKADCHLANCSLCEHRCFANRQAGDRGPCKAGSTARLFRHQVEYGDELEMVPSHLFYLSGCDLRCVFCIAEEDAFNPARGQELTSELFNRAVEWGRAKGARNIQWIGGEPTIHLPAILRVMSKCPDLPPVVWKSDFYGTPEAFELLSGVVQTYVADFKFGNNDCAKRLCGVSNYVETIQRNLKIAAGQGRLIVRHLLLPGHTDCCLQPIVEWMKRELPDVPLSLRDGYLPAWRSERIVELSRPMDRKTFQAAKEIVDHAGLKVVT